VGGANGSIAAGRVARAAPDGYTVSLGLWNTHVSNGVLYDLKYDVVDDFEPVALLAFSLTIVARKDMAAKDLKEFIAWLKANPSKATQRSAGAGSMGTSPAFIFRTRSERAFACAVPRFRARNAGFGGRPHRHDDRRSGDNPTAAA
jgi:tripartite-type tricarboxylate transporter receptor subunit TctC